MSEFIDSNVQSFINDNNDNFAVLKLVVTGNDDLKRYYEKKIHEHNREITSSLFPNSGFDLCIPKYITFTSPLDNVMVDLEVKCEMLYYDYVKLKSSASPYYMYPRSSISKTPLILSNSTGIIDSGYRGNLIAAFRYLSNSCTPYTIDKYNRLIQICHPSLCKIYVVLVSKNEELSVTERGDGGFGSTGL
jgi:dUTP pyrophosphatase